MTPPSWLCKSSKSRKALRPNSEHRSLSLERLESRQLLTANEVIAVPFSQADLSLPHYAHEDAHITLKAIVRNATGAAGYEVAWDTDRDGDYSDEFSHTVTPEANSKTIRDIGRTFEVPNVDAEGRMDITVRVTDLETGTEHFGTFKLYVFDWSPSPDPRVWSEFQVEVMSSMAVQETLWYTHRQLTNLSGDHSTNQIRGEFTASGSGNSRSESLALQLFAENSHLPAFPDGTVTGGSLPTGWTDRNASKWNHDPYAETAARLLNFLTESASLQSIPSAEEAPTAGFTPTGTEIIGNRLPGTTDSRGVRVTAGFYAGMWQQPTAGALLGIAPTLDHLAGVPIQRGGLAGNSYEWLVQQMVDYVGYAQIDGSSGVGGWRESTTPVNGSLSSSSSSSANGNFARMALASAELNGSPFGVLVNNRHKFRSATNLQIHQHPDGLTRWRGNSTSRGGLADTGMSIGALRWMGVHRFSRGDATIAFPGYSNLNRDTLRRIYDTYLAATAQQWNSSNRRDGVNWLDGFWQFGDYLAGNTNSVYNANGAYNILGLWYHSEGYRIGTPDLGVIGAHDWEREFNISLMRGQDRNLSQSNPLSAYSQFGRVFQDYSTYHSAIVAYMQGLGGTILAGQTMTAESRFWDALFEAEASPTLAYTVDLTALTDGAVAYQWDVDPGNGLWWETGGSPDAQGQIASYTFSQAGNYDVTLRVVDSSGDSSTHTVTVTVVEPLATVDEVLVGAAAWGPTFVDAVDGSGAEAGNGLGYSLTGAHQLETLPWNSIDQVHVRFNLDNVSTSIDAGDFALIDSEGNQVPFSLLPFGQEGARVATLQLVDPLGIDRLVLSVDANGITNGNGQALDGEWTTGQAGPSGDLSEGGQFDFFFNVLPGDADASGQVTVLDALGVVASDTEGTVEANARRDIDTSGQVTVLDAFAAFANNTFGLPNEPTPHNFAPPISLIVADNRPDTDGPQQTRRAPQVRPYLYSTRGDLLLESQSTHGGSRSDLRAPLGRASLEIDALDAAFEDPQDDGPLDPEGLGQEGLATSLKALRRTSSGL